MRIAVLTSSDVSREVLKMLHESGQLVGIASCDKQYRDNSRIREFASERNLPFVAVSRKQQTQELSQWIHDCAADVVFSISFRYLVPSDVLKLPRLGCYNFHNGKLPEERGTDPAFWQIKSRAPSTYTVHKMDEQYDTGEILLEHPISYQADETYLAHHRRLAKVLRDVAEQTLHLLKRHRGFPPTTVQSSHNAGWLGRACLRDVTVDWQLDKAEDIRAMVLASYPTFAGALTIFRDDALLLIEVSLAADSSPLKRSDALTRKASTIRKRPPGELYLDDERESLFVSCAGTQDLKINVLIYRQEFMSGYRFAKYYQCRAGDAFKNANKDSKPNRAVA